MEAGQELKREETTINGIQNVPYGNNAWIWCKKNRSTRGFIKVPISIIFGKGVANVFFLKDVMQIYGLYTVGGAGYFKPAVPGLPDDTIRGTELFHKWIYGNRDFIYAYLNEHNMLLLTQGEVMTADVEDDGIVE